MISVSSQVTELLQSNTTLLEYATLTLLDNTVITLTPDDFTITNNYLVDGASETVLPLGAAIEKIIQIEIINPNEQYNAYDFFGATIELSLKFEPNGQVVQTFNRGRYTVIEPAHYGDTIIITAVDDMYKADQLITNTIEFPITIKTLAYALCLSIGITLSTASFTNENLSLTAFAGDYSKYTYRQMFGFLAQLVGGNARINYENKLEFITYNFTPVTTLNNWRTLTLETDDVIITGIKTTLSGEQLPTPEPPEEDEEEVEVPDSETHIVGTSDYTLTVINPFMNSDNVTTLLGAIGSLLIGETLRPFEGEYIANPLIEFMDAVTIVDKRGSTYNSVITDIQYNVLGHTAIKNSAESVIRNRQVFTSLSDIVLYTAAGDAVKAKETAISAEDKADQAYTFASVAAQAASDAQESADEAAQAAATAEENAQQAIEDAAVAKDAADAAQESADDALEAAESATTSANSALTQLSIVEDVVDVLTWISDHGTYAKTTDTDIIPGKYYFTRSGSSGNYTYTVVPNPVKSSLGSYYELTGVDEAVSNYISSHLALTNQGLWLVNDDNGWKILIKNTGIEIYNTAGTKIVEYGSSITFNSSTPFTMGSSSAGITFDGSSITINGANVTFANGNTIADYAEADDIPDTSGLLTSVTTKDQYYLSTSSSSATGGSWGDTVPTWSSGKYIWTRVATTKTNANGSTTTYSTAVYDRALTTALSTATTANTTADAAAPKSDAIARTQRIYYRKTSSGAPSKNMTWLSTSGTGYGNWSLSIPQLTNGTTKYPYLYTAIQMQTIAQQAAGTACSCSTVLLDETTTVIDGGSIITGSVTANQIDATNLHVSAANVDGTLTIGQLPSTVAETSDIPTAVSELTNDSGYATTTQAQSYASSAQSAAEATAAADATSKANEAAKTASSFISRIDGGGIKVHDAGDVNNYSKINSLGMEVYQGGNSVAFFGTTTQIGQTSGSYVSQNSTSWKMVDANKGAYAAIENIKSGSTTTVTEHFIAAYEYTNACKLYFPNPTSIAVEVEGTSTSSFTFNSSTNTVTINVDTFEGAAIDITYSTNSDSIKAYTFGYRTDTPGALSFSESISDATGIAAHSEGFETLASGDGSHAEGRSTEASGVFSHAQGEGTIAAGRAQTVIGTYNEVDEDFENYAFIVGNGWSDSSRGNSFLITWSGDIHFNPLSDLRNAINALGWLNEVEV